MAEENFIDEVKQKVLYTRRNAGEVSMMLDYGKANKYLNTELARVAVSIKSTTASWKGNWNGLFDDVIEHAELQMLGLEGYSREQAIRMKGEVAKIAQEEKTGIMKVLGGTK